MELSPLPDLEYNQAKACCIDISITMIGTISPRWWPLTCSIERRGCFGTEPSGTEHSTYQKPVTSLNMQDKHMGTTTTPEEKMDAALGILDQAHDQVLKLIDGISQADSESRPGPDAWSIGEVAHHLLLVEKRHCQGMLEMIAADQRGNFSWEQVLAERPIPLEDMADVSKSGKGKAPEGTRPDPGLVLKELAEDLRQLRRQTKSQLLPHRSRNLDDL